jgi:hypothetical protein
MIRVVLPPSRIQRLTFYSSRILDPGVKKAPDPGSRILDPGSRILDPGSRIQRSKRHRILDPGSWTRIRNTASNIQRDGSMVNVYKADFMMLIL